jgi:hypothetical protein
LLNKAIYGLKQTGRAWQHELVAAIESADFKQWLKEPCIFYKHNNNHLTLISTYVNNLLITGNDPSELKKIEQALASKFRMKNLGELEQFLEIEATKTENGMILTQKEYTKSIVKKFGQENCKDRSSPMDKTYGPKEDQQHKDDKQYPVREAIGSLMYLANNTRPDITFVVSWVAQHVTKPTKQLWKIIQHIIRYIKATKELGLKFEEGNFEITGWVDSDYAGAKALIEN